MTAKTKKNSESIESGSIDSEQNLGEIKHGFVTTPRMQFHYRTHGDPDGMPMLLVHGSFGSSRWWEPFINLLPLEIYAIAVDLRGSGQSEQTDTGYTIAEQAADLLSFVQVMGLEEIDLVAHSSGGAIAVEFVLNNYALVSTLSLVDSVPLEGVFTPLDTVMLLEQMKTDDELLRRSLSLLMPTIDNQLFGFGDETEDDALFADDNLFVDDNNVGAINTGTINKAFCEAIVTDAATMSPVLFTAMASSLSNWNRFADAFQLTLPSLIIWGDRDEIVSRDATTRTLIALPGANNLEILRGVGHSPMIEAPLTLAEKIIDFITEDYAAFGSVRDSI